MTGELQHRDAARDLHKMLREMAWPNGTRRLLRWLAEQINGWAMLLGPGGETLCADPGPIPDLPPDAADVIESVVLQRRQAAATNVGACNVWALAIEPEATLVVARQGAFPLSTKETISCAASLLRLQRRADLADRKSRELAQSESFIREAVLQLIMIGQLDGARRSAGALRHELPDPLRVYVIEATVGGREEPARLCSKASGGRAWVIRCPVYSRHVIVLIPAGEDQTVAQLDDALRTLTARMSEVCVGVGQTVALWETPIGYEQAFHALAVARTIPERFAVFGGHAELAKLIGPAGQGWANEVLYPLLEFTPERNQDPDSYELMATLRSWLSFYGRASGQLKIHRNTLTARLRRIEGTLGCELDDLVTQTKLHLALRLLGHSRGVRGEDPEGLGAVLRGAPVRRWAESLLSPVLVKESLVTTLRAWLSNNARLDATAAVLGVSVPGVRKRLVRIEEILGRSLLNGPSARYDLLIALRIHDGDPAF